MRSKIVANLKSIVEMIVQINNKVATMSNCVSQNQVIVAVRIIMEMKIIAVIY